MWLIAGLGNPEKKYNGTRHNAGFAVIDTLLDTLGGKGLESTKFHGAFTKTRIGTEDVSPETALPRWRISTRFRRNRSL